MSNRLAGKVATIPGSTKGVGLAIARAYVREGARVVVNSRSAAAVITGKVLTVDGGWSP